MNKQEKITLSWMQEREGSLIELFIRRIISSLFYFRGYRYLYAENPYYTPKAIRYLSRYIRPDLKLFEWGSGKSTLWYAKRLSQVVTVEHNRHWYDTVVLLLKENRIHNTQVLYRPEDHKSTSYPWEREWRYYPLLCETPDNPALKNYIFAIDTFPDQHFDIIVIDGRERLACLMHALDKLNENGLLLFDDSARPRYKKCFEILRGWPFKKFDFGLKQTTIFARNKNSL